MAEEQEPKIIVDADWKEEARKEKERADREAQEMPPNQLPDPSFYEIVSMIVMQATAGLGLLQYAESGQRVPPNLPLARHYIDLLELLQSKTAGQLSEDEKGLLDNTLNDLRMAFVQVSSAAAASAAPPNAGDKV